MHMTCCRLLRVPHATDVLWVLVGAAVACGQHAEAAGRGTEGPAHPPRRALRTTPAPTTAPRALRTLTLSLNLMLYKFYSYSAQVTVFLTPILIEAPRALPGGGRPARWGPPRYLSMPLSVSLARGPAAGITFPLTSMPCAMRSALAQECYSSCGLAWHGCAGMPFELWPARRV